MKLTQLIETKERLYVCVHAKTPKHEVYAKSSYDAAKQAAEYWGMKSTAGIDAHLVEGNYPEPRKMQVTQADKDNNTEAWKRFRAGDPRYEWKDMILSKREGDVSEAVGEFAQPIYDLIDDLGGDNDAHEIVLNDMVRYLGGDTIQDFVKDFRSNHDMNHPGEDGDYGEDDKNFESVKEATHGEAKPIYDLVGSLGAGDIELAQNPIFQDLVRFLDADTINKFVTQFRRKMAKDNDFKGSVDFGQYKESVIRLKESYDDYHGDMSKEEYDKTVKGSEMEYTVWVGGTEPNDNWLTYDEALKLFDRFKAQGHDDVQLDVRIKQEIPQDIPMGIRPFPKGVVTKAEEGSFWGRDDMVAQMKRDELAAGMRKYTKDVDGNHHGATTSDPEEWERLEADGYEWDKDYYKDIKEERVDELLPALAVGALAAKAVGSVVGGAAKAVASGVGAATSNSSLNASKKSKKNKKKLNAVKEKQEKDDLVKAFDPKTARAVMMLKAKYPQADNILSALLADVENKEKDSDVTDLSQDYKMEKLTKAVEVLQKEINLLKGNKKLNAVKEKAKPDFLDLDKDGNKKEPMKKAVKDKKKNEAYNPETGRDPNKPTPEWDNLIAKAKKKQGISDEEEVWFNYEDIGGNIIVNPKSTVEDQIGELLNRYYDISPMEFDPSKIEITTPDQTNQDASFAKTQNARHEGYSRNTPVQEDKYSDLNPTNKFGYFGGPGFYSNDGSTYTEPHYDDFDIRQHNRDNPEDKVKLNNWADFNLKMRYHKKDGKRVQGFGGMGYNVSFHGNPKDVEAFAMQHLDAERYSGDNIPESESLNASHESLASSLIASRQAKRQEVKKVREDDDVHHGVDISGPNDYLIKRKGGTYDKGTAPSEKDDDSEAIKARDAFVKMVSKMPKSNIKPIDTIKKIVADKQNMQVKFDDGKMKVDLYTASAVSKVYDAVKPGTQGKIDDMLRTKDGMLRMANFAFSKLSEGVKAGKRIDEILPLAAIGAVAGGIARAAGMAATRVAPAVGKIAKSAIKHPIKTAAVAHTLKDKDKTVTQKASKIARITGGMPSTNPRAYESDDLDELQAPYTGADAVIDKMGKKHKPGSPRANMIINMKKKAPVAKPLQNKTANTSGVKPAQSTVKPAGAGVGRGNAPGSKATQIQPGGGSKAGKEKMKVSGKTKAVAALGTAKHIAGKAKGFLGKALSKAADKSGFGNPLAASEYSPEDKAVEMMKGAMKKVEELNLKPSGKITVKRIPAKGPKGYTPGDHHPPTKFKASVKF